MYGSWNLLFLFMVYLMTLTVAQAVYHRMAGRLMNDEFGGVWKVAKTTKNLRPIDVSTETGTDYLSEALQPEPTCSLGIF
jgi:hypothetical protein